jgi:hypothetical protein
MPNNPGSRLPTPALASPSQLLRPDRDPRHGQIITTAPSLPGAGAPFVLDKATIDASPVPPPDPAVGEGATPPPDLQPWRSTGAVPFRLNDK